LPSSLPTSEHSLRFSISSSLSVRRRRTCPSNSAKHTRKVAWREIAGLRNILVHAYHRVSFREVWRVVEDELPRLIEFIDELLASRQE
jgi:uncharacterized protein with HEPN domain